LVFFEAGMVISISTVSGFFLLATAALAAGRPFYGAWSTG